MHEKYKQNNERENPNYQPNRQQNRHIHENENISKRKIRQIKRKHNATNHEKNEQEKRNSNREKKSENSCSQNQKSKNIQNTRNRNKCSGIRYKAKPQYKQKQHAINPGRNVRFFTEFFEYPKENHAVRCEEFLIPFFLDGNFFDSARLELFSKNLFRRTNF